jgi:hypothetical protein
MTPPTEHATLIAAIAVAAVVFFAASALAHRMICMTPQCVAAGAIVHALTPQR